MAWGFIQHLGKVASGIERQVNPFDNSKTYKNQQESGNASTISNIGKTAKGFAEGAIASPKFFAETDIINPAKQLAGSFTGNKVAANNAIKSQFKGATSAGGALRQVGGNAAQLGFTFLAPEVAGLAERGIAAAGLKGTASKIASSATTGAAIGAPFNAAATVASNEKLTPGSLAKSAAYGAAGGALLGAAAPAIHAGLKEGAPVVAQVAKDYAGRPRVSAKEQLALSNWSDYLSDKEFDSSAPGFNDLAKEAHDAAQKHGVDISTGTRYERSLRIGDFLNDVQKKGGHGGESGAGINPARAFHEAGPEDSIGKLAKATTVKEVKDIIGDRIPGPVVEHIAPALAKVDSPHAVSEIIARESPQEPGAPPPRTVAPPPPEVPQTTESNVPLPPTPTEALESQTPGKQRAFLETVQNSKNSSEELVKGAKELNQHYEAKANQALVDKAQKSVSEDPHGALADVLSAENPNDQQVTTGIELMRQAQKEGTPEGIQRAVNIADHLDIKLRESGRAVQAASIYDKLSPEGILQLAAKRVGKAREKAGKGKKEAETVQQIKDAVESARPQQDLKDAIRGAVKDISNNQGKLDLGGLEGPPQAVDSTGRQLAKNVEKAALPEVKKKADTLVQELTKKVKQEYLDPKVTVKRSPTEVLKEVFGRTDEAHEAYPLAQHILRDKYKNVPTMLKALDKFFGSELKLPAADSTINNAIKEHLAKNQTKISEVIEKSWNEQKRSVSEVSDSLVKEGFDKPSADVLAREVNKRLEQQVSDAKGRALNRLAQDAKPNAQKTYLEKINKLSNLGALDQSDYLHIARAKLNLPSLSTENATKITELSQKIQGLPEGHDKYATVRQIQNLIADSVPKSKGAVASEIAGLPRTIEASGDFSFGGRQALAYATAHPIKFAKAFPEQFTYFKQAFNNKDSEAFDAMMADIRNHEDFNWLQKSPLAITEPTGHSSSIREEQFMSSGLGEKIPGLGKLISGSNYAFTGLANSLRANEFYGQLEHARFAGREIDQKLVDDLAKVINNGTGRGDLGRFEKAANSLVTVLFAPRLIASRLNMMDYRYYKNLDPIARKEALRQLAGLSAFAVGILGTAKLAGLDVGTDPRSADFGKIRVKDTRIDLLGGFSQYIRLGSQIGTGHKINSTTGADTELGKGFAGSRLDVLYNFIQNKENPTVSFFSTELKGKDVSGNSIYNAKGQLTQLGSKFIPLIIQDMHDLVTHPNSVGPAGIIPSVFGAGIQTYGAQDEPISGNPKKFLDQQKQQGASKDEIKADMSFFQNLKIASGRNQNVSDQINAALKDRDINKAKSLADDYNKKIDEAVSKWQSQNNQYEKPFLIKEAQSAKIKPSGFGARIKNLQKASQGKL